MAQIIKNFIRKLFAIERINFGLLEMFLQRGLMSYIIMEHLWKRIEFTSQPHPTGLAHFFDLTFIESYQNYQILSILLLIALILWTLNYFTLLALGYIAWALIISGTLYNSQGETHHNTQIISLIMLSFLIGYTWKFFKEKNKLQNFCLASLTMQRKGTWLALQAIAAAYFLAGFIKIYRSGIGWIADLPDISLQMVKTGMQRYLGRFDTDAMQLGYENANIVLDNINLFRFIMTLGLLAELFAFFMLFNRKLSFIVGLSLLIMHISIRYTMQLPFFLNEASLCIFVINVPFIIIISAKVINYAFSKNLE